MEYPESSIVKLAKSKMRLKVGKTSRIKAHLGIPMVNNLFPAGHERVLRFYSSDKRVATVTKSGKVKAKSKGTCKIYVIATNGAGKTVTVTVK